MKRYWYWVVLLFFNMFFLIQSVIKNNSLGIVSNIMWIPIIISIIVNESGKND